MNDLLYLTLEPEEGGHELAWRRVRPLVDGIEEAFASIARGLDIPDLVLEGATLTLVGAPTAGSLRFRFKLEIQGQFVRPQGKTRPDNDAKELKSLAQQVGVNALGGVIAATVMLVLVGPQTDPSPGIEARLAKACAARAQGEVEGAIGEVYVLADGAGCTSARIEYESFLPLELVAKVDPIKIKGESRADPPERLEMYLSSRRSVTVYVDGEPRVGYFVTRLDDQTDSLAIFQRAIPKANLSDRLLVKSRRLKPKDRGRLFVSPMSLRGAHGEDAVRRLAGVRSVLVVDAIYGPMRG